MSEQVNQSSEAGFEDAREALIELDEAQTPYPEPAAKVVERLSRYIGEYPTRNLAVELCDKAFSNTVEQALKEAKPRKLAKELGKLAFCSALPKLTCARNIRDFIACVTHAMAVGILPGAEGTRLLFGAKIAHTARTKRPKKRNQVSHSNTAKTALTPNKSAA